MRFSFPLTAVAFLLMQSAASAIHEEDAGVLDFLVSTSGHSVTQFVDASLEGSIVTTDVHSGSSSSCFIANRAVEDGTLMWRRNVCSTTGGENIHDIATTTDNVYTIDNDGSVRAWTKETGHLIWDARVQPSTSPKVWSYTKQGMQFVVAASKEEVSIFHAESGKLFDDKINVAKAVGSAKAGESLAWLAAVPDTADSGKILSILSFVKEDGTSSRMNMVELEIGNDAIVSHKSLGHAKGEIIASSVKLQKVDNSWQAVAVTTDGNLVYFGVEGSNFSKTFSASQLMPEWEIVSAVRSTKVPSTISVQSGDQSALFSVDDSGGLTPFEIEGASLTAMTQCYEANIDIGLTADSLRVYRDEKPLTLEGDLFVPDGDVIEQLSIVSCSTDKASALLSTASGTTTMLGFDLKGSSVDVKIGWSTEEGLGSISSAVMLDASHLGSDDLVEEETAVVNKLSLSSRLSSQLSSILSLGGNGNSRRDHTFGFVKVAALLSQKTDRIWGLNTSGEDRGKVRWSLDLLKSAEWHTMVHGTTNSNSAVHGINGGTHSREILVLSASKGSVEWKCIDGTTGAVNAQDSVSISSPVLQVIPMYGGADGCRQASLLLHDDKTLTAVPSDSSTMALVGEQLRKSPNGLFTHFVDKEASRVVSYQVIEGSNNGLGSIQVGQATFAGETIVKVGYPIRDEIVQSMSSVLGDDSLLLKYINPHIAVVVTMSDADEQTPTEIATTIQKQDTKKKGRKPAGAGNAAEQIAPASVPNMFINVVDTVSGRVLHRAGHSNADPSREVTTLISENWIVYSFVNSVTRRTELGVLTLHEGMIDKKGMTMFSSPQQTTTFSSFDARESKPVVLAKLYIYPNAITALGATATRGGISNRKILIASTDGRVTAIDRSMIETRRPMGEAKETEKKEGLVPYRELIPEVSLFALSYNQTVESPSSIVSTYASLESQSLVMAFGGPDLFFTRTSPSRGFDLLPDTFSRILVFIVTIGLIVVLFVVKNMGSKKALKQGW
eukprot:CAMPEP_0113617062 /NCGR_PEP_ID=MMETSP0017_2-20120614/8574_1 /TAXON_ID=2856 /ORGANISM="Cylindrotheca closterium" /LENGTH=1007 /DNA_ID=CAMNT_0000526421 /DNA_START=127 /DNA_END=3147 /DNA_ORIENTATION=- /assembly_acc=CAM_ASM_000147